MPRFVRSCSSEKRSLQGAGPLLQSLKLYPVEEGKVGAGTGRPPGKQTQESVHTGCLLRSVVEPSPEEGRGRKQGCAGGEDAA